MGKLLHGVSTDTPGNSSCTEACSVEAEMATPKGRRQTCECLRRKIRWDKDPSPGKPGKSLDGLKESLHSPKPKEIQGRLTKAPIALFAMQGRAPSSLGSGHADRD